jgi:N-acetylated-alpha-linked acidic dipeptidase
LRPLIFGIACVIFVGNMSPSTSRGGREPNRILGFSARGTKHQLGIEARFKAIPQAEEIRRWHRYFTAEPHPATSARTEEIARFIEKQWKEQGLEDVVIHRYDVLSSSPREIRVEMVEPEHYVPGLREDVYDVDSDTAHPDVSGAWTSFSASGEVTAPVVYAASGNPADYELLRENGIDPTGKIVIVRYSNPYSYRGFKALTAEREGAAAMIVYSDPAEDGYEQGKVYPDGPWGPESHVQRGGIAYDFIVPGDPLTPGWAATTGAHRIDRAEAVSVPKIMAVPMSYRDIRPILEKMGGPLAPEAWQGGLPIEYRLGGESVRLHVAIDMDSSIKPNYVIEGRIRGSELPDEWVVLGNHHDAWVFGGVDPSSGTASMMEMTGAFGQLKKQGVRPRRTIVFCSWDGEEVTLTGSTEWGEQFSADLKEKAVAYLNVDSSSSGSELSVSAVGSLAPMIVELTRSLDDPSGSTLYEAWRRKRPAPDLPEGALLDDALVETRIGSGTDHTVFLNYLGRPVVDMTFDGPYGVYHSAYDNHFWVSRIGDPGFKYHLLMSQLWGMMAMRLANAEILPLDFESYAAAIRDFVGEVETVDRSDRLDLDELTTRTREMRGAARRLNHRVQAALAEGNIKASLAASINKKLMKVEANWLNPAGIPGRPWFKHLLYAPKFTYAAMVLPGVMEAAESDDWETAQAQAKIVVAAIAKNAALLESAAKDLAGYAPAPGSLEGKLRGIRERFDGRMGIYVKNLEVGERVAIDADSVYETFSVIKVPIMAEVLRLANEGEISLSERIALKESDRRIPSGVLYALEAGLQPTIKDLLTLMVIISDNEATDILAGRVGPENVTAFMESLGLSRTRLRFSDLDWDRLWLSQLDANYAGAGGDETIRFPFQDHRSEDVDDAFRRVIEETPLYFGRSTAREIGQLFALLARGELVSAEASRFMISILEKQQVADRFPRYLGEGVRIAHKTGDGQPYVGNDAGILWIDGKPIVLVVFTSHHRGTGEELDEAVALVAATVADHYGGQVTRVEK